MDKKLKNKKGIATIAIVLIVVAVIAVVGVVVYKIVADTHYQLKINTGDIAEEYLDSYSSYIGLDDDELDELVDILNDIDISLDLYADGNDITKIKFSMDYGKALEKLYDFVVDNDLDDGEFDDYDDFEDSLYDELDDEGFDEDAIIEAYVELLEEIDADYDEDDVEDLVEFDLDEKKGKFELSIKVVDEINEYIADYMEDNYDDMMEALEEVADEYDFEIDIDEDTYLEDFIKFAAGCISDYSTLKKNGWKVDVDDYGFDIFDMMSSVYSSALNSLVY